MNHKLRLLFVLLILIFSTALESRAQWSTPTVAELTNHSGFNWKSDLTTNFRFYFEPNTFSEKHIDQLKEKAEQARQRSLALLAEPRYESAITVFVLESRTRMKALLGRETNGQALPNRNAVLFVYSDTLNASGVHEFCHVFSIQLWGKTEAWLSEGLAVYSDDRWWSYQLHALAKYLLINKKLIPLVDLIKHFDRYPELITYPESGSLMKFLYEKYGVSKVKEIWKKPASLERITGRRLVELERDWHELIAQSDTSRIKY